MSLDNQQIRLGLIECFRSRLVAIVQAEPLLDFITFIPAAEREEIRSVGRQNGNQAAVHLLLNKVNTNSGVEGWFGEFITALNRTGCSHGAAYVTPEASDLVSPELEARNDLEVKLIICLTPTVIDNLSPDEVSVHCCAADILTEDDKEKILSEMKQRGKQAATRELLSRIVMKPPGWFSKFLDILRKSGHEDLAEILSGDDSSLDIAEPADLENTVNEADTEQSVQKVDQTDQLYVSPATDGEICLRSEESDENPALLDTSLLDSSVNSGKNGTVYVNVPDSDDESTRGGRGSPVPEIKLRDYQQEVAVPALEGKNIIICLPTGSGKTRVAVYITRHHLNNMKCQGKTGKVIVLVNKVPLVDQHFRKEFNAFLKDKYSVSKISGDTQLKISFPHVVRQNDIIICTAQILENQLAGLNCDDEDDDDDSLKLSDFTLIIIDECHHTQKEGVYKSIMTRYIEQKLKNKKGDVIEPLPQILGLTASPGVGGAKNRKAAQSHVLQICANLDAYRIMTVQNFQKQLKDQVKEPVKKMEIAEERREDPFGDRIKQMMNKIHTFLEQAATTDFGTQSYEQLIVRMCSTGAKEENRKLRACAEHLRKYNDALVINDTIRMIDAYNYLTNFYEEEIRKKMTDDDEDDPKSKLDQTDRFLFQLFNENQKELQTVAKEPQYENGNLAKLRKTVLQEFTKKKESRGIIFTKTRQNTHALHEWIEQNEKFTEVGIKAHYLTGAGNNSQYKHMTQHEQKEVLNKFHDGEINLLIATTVAEEGLDIKECNFVIRYDLVTNEIAMVQARGRARCNDSTYALVALDGSGVVDREFVNEFREKMMYKAIQKVQEMSADDYKKQVEERQIQNIMELKMKRRKDFAKRIQSDYSKVAFHCYGCSKLACSGKDVQVIESMHHVNITKEFKDLYGVRENRALQEKSLDYQTNGEIYCKECAQTWGSMMVHRGVNLPCLSIKNFVVYIDEKHLQKQTYKKWNEVPFRLPKFDFISYAAGSNI
uniref:RNA helicase n=1 Tax=Callorhinchus milii TaxID=7868 RepID=A0A4W3HNW4_CALMI